MQEKRRLKSSHMSQRYRIETFKTNVESELRQNSKGKHGQKYFILNIVKTNIDIGKEIKRVVLTQNNFCIFKMKIVKEQHSIFVEQDH